MIAPKNGAAVHFILSDSILSLLRNSELGLYQRPLYKRFEPLAKHLHFTHLISGRGFERYGLIRQLLRSRSA